MTYDDHDLIATDEMIAAEHRIHDRLRYVVVPKGHVVEGDIYANGGTVTKVVVGPTKKVIAGLVRIECGKGFSVMGDRRALVVVGRREQA